MFRGSLTPIFDLDPGPFLGILAGVVVVYELFHMLTHPLMCWSWESYVGVLPKSFLVYTSYQGIKPVCRVLLPPFTPFYVLTTLPALACLAGYIPMHLVHVAFAIFLLNMLASAGDMLLVGIVLNEFRPGYDGRGDYFGLAADGTSE